MNSIEAIVLRMKQAETEEKRKGGAEIGHKETAYFEGLF